MRTKVAFALTAAVAAMLAAVAPIPHGKHGQAQAAVISLPLPIFHG